MTFDAPVKIRRAHGRCCNASVAPLPPTPDVLEVLSAALQADPWTREQHTIRLEADDARLTLAGQVERVAAKRRALVLARLLGRDYEIVDHIRRKALVPAAADDVANRAVQRFLADPVFRGCRFSWSQDTEVYGGPGSNHHCLSISARDGVITLAGTVGNWSQWRLAEVFAWWIDECQCVDNELTVTPPREDGDHEINHAVQLALAKDTAIEARQLHVSTAAAIVQLEGLLANPAERMRAIEDVWLVSGVWDVDDRIQLRSDTESIGALTRPRA